MVRTTLVLLHPTVVTTDDANDYERLALSLLQGSYSLAAGVPTVERAPGYPFFLAAIFALFGHSLLIAQIASCVLGALVAGGAWLLGRRLHGPVAGTVAGVLTAIDPYQVDATTKILSEALFTAGIVATALMALRAQRTGRLRDWATVGALAGASALVRPAALMLGGVLGLVALATLGPTRRGLVTTVMVGLVAAAMALPWTVRNYVVTGQVVVVATAYRGMNLWTGSLAATDGAWPGYGAARAYMDPITATLPRPPATQSDDVRAELDRQITQGVSPAADQALTAAAIANIRADPVGYLWLCLRNFARTWLQPEGVLGLVGRLVSDPTMRLPVFLILAAPQVLGVIGTAVLGFATVARAPAAWPVAATIAYYIVIHSMVPGDLRHRVPVEPLIFTFCGIGAARLLARRGGLPWLYPVRSPSSSPP